MRSFVMALALLNAAPAFAQVNSRPTDAPIVTAENESWFRKAEPVQFAGGLYYPAGASVFFNGHTMVRTGHYNGIPLYADTTIEPYSIVLVPVDGQVLQPYERRRDGDLAGTTGSRLPSFPVGSEPGASGIAMAAVSPTNLPRSIGTIAAAPPEAQPAGAGGQGDTQPVVVLLRPENNDGIWVRFGGQKWLSAGPAVPLRASDFQLIGDYAGFPVFSRQGVKEDVIYIPTRAGLIAPYRLKP